MGETTMTDNGLPINKTVPCALCRRDLTEEQLAPDPLPDGRRVCPVCADTIATRNVYAILAGIGGRTLI